MLIRSSRMTEFVMSIARIILAGTATLIVSSAALAEQGIVTKIDRLKSYDRDPAHGAGTGRNHRREHWRRRDRTGRELQGAGRRLARGRACRRPGQLLDHARRCSQDDHQARAAEVKGRAFTTGAPAARLSRADGHPRFASERGRIGYFRPPSRILVRNKSSMTMIVSTSPRKIRTTRAGVTSGSNF